MVLYEKNSLFVVLKKILTQKDNYLLVNINKVIELTIF